MFGRKKYLCSNCKTGKVSYELDNHSEACPYISCYEGNNCNYYEPLETKEKTILDKILDVFATRK